MTEEIDILIIGAGVIGCSIAYELSKSKDREIAVIERNKKIPGENQSSRNSGVIHAGIYYPKDKSPLKASLCLKGNRLLYEFCQEHKVPHKKIGKLVVATNKLEEDYLNDVFKIAKENKVPDIKIINKEKIKEYEPNVEAVKALYVPTTGIVDSTELVNKLYSLSKLNNVIFATYNEVINISNKNNKFKITAKSNNNFIEFEAKFLINSAGLYSDEIAKMINPDSPYEIDPIRGETAKFYKKRKDISMKGLNIYPVPYGFLPDGNRLQVPFSEFQKLFSKGKITKSVGVHLTPTLEFFNSEYFIGKTVTLGPAYKNPSNKEDYSQTRKEEYYLEMVKPFFPNLKLEDITLDFSGIRAKLRDYYDFVIEKDSKHKNCINLIGIDSPGLTCSLAIAKYVKELINN